MSQANWSTLWRISLLATVLVGGCTGIDPNVIYTPQQAEEANRELETLTKEPLRKFLAKEALSDQDKDHLRKALPILQKITAYDPITINSYAMAGKIHLALDEPQQAMDCYLDGIAKTKPNDTPIERTIRSDLYIEMADLHLRNNDSAAAERALRTAILIEDTSSQAHVMLGRILQSRGDTAGAKEEALKALLADAEYEPARTFYQEVNGKKAASP